MECPQRPTLATECLELEEPSKGRDFGPLAYRSGGTSVCGWLNDDDCDRSGGTSVCGWLNDDDCDADPRHE